MNKENKILLAALGAVAFIFFIHLGISITICVKYGAIWASVSAFISNMIQFLSFLIMSQSPCVKREDRPDGKSQTIYLVIHAPVLVILILAARNCDLGESKYNCEALETAGLLLYTCYGLLMMIGLSMHQASICLSMPYVSGSRQDPSQADRTYTNNQIVHTRPSSNPQVRLPVTEPTRLQSQTTAQDSRSRVDQHQSRQNLQHSPAKPPPVYTLPSVDSNIRRAPEIDNLWNVSTNV